MKLKSWQSPQSQVRELFHQRRLQKVLRPNIFPERLCFEPRSRAVAEAHYAGFSVRCLAQASATLLSTLSSPGMIAQLCFSI